MGEGDLGTVPFSNPKKIAQVLERGNNRYIPLPFSCHDGLILVLSARSFPAMPLVLSVVLGLFVISPARFRGIKFRECLNILYYTKGGSNEI